MKFAADRYLLTLIFIMIPAGFPSAFTKSLPGNRITDLTPMVPFAAPGIISGGYTWDSPEDTLTIPLRRAGNIFLIEAVVDGENGYLVFDTGASRLVLNRTYFRDHVVMNTQLSAGITGDVNEAERISVENIKISGLKFENLIADVANLGHIENRRGVKILGLIGFAMMRDFEVVFDPQQSQLQLFRVNKKGERTEISPSGFNPDYTCKFTEKNNILFLSIKIDGRSMTFCLDTGAETNVLDVDVPRSVLSTVTITRRSTLNGAGTATSDVLFGKMNGFRFGGKNIDNMETVITNLGALSEAYDTKIDGMLGYSFLSKGVICINFVKKEFSIRFSNQAEE